MASKSILTATVDSGHNALRATFPIRYMKFISIANGILNSSYHFFKNCKVGSH